MTSSPATAHDDGGLGWLVLVAPLLFGLLVAVLLLGSMAGWHPLWPMNQVTLSEAVALRDIPTTLALISQGHDPNAAYDVRQELLASRIVRVTPLEAAVTTREPYVMQTLIDNGARIDDANRTGLVCLARRTNAPEIEAQLLEQSTTSIDCANVTLPW